jgi:response regulator RpfG family c-di-GMP phosphodiesterase
LGVPEVQQRGRLLASNPSVHLGAKSVDFYLGQSILASVAERTAKTPLVSRREEVMNPGSGSRKPVTSVLTQSRLGQVLIVDDELSFRNVLAVMLNQEGVPCKTAATAEEALRILEREHVDAVLADLQMPRISGMELLAEVRLRYPHLVFLMVTGVDEVRVGMEAMRKGADDYLVKPLPLHAVLASLERALQKKRLEQEVENYRQPLEEWVGERTEQLQTALRQIELSYEDTMEALGAAIDLRDSPTAGHSRRVFLYSTKIAQAMGGLESQLKNIAMGAWLHDIGKLAIPDAILLKPGALTDAERTIMQRHARIGYDLVKRIPFLSGAAEIILTHHERCDGSGYPRGLKMDEIPIGARIFAVSDSVDAMTSDRPYRLALPFQEARETIERESGRLFDSRVAAVFLSSSTESWEAVRTQTAKIQLSTAILPPNTNPPGGLTIPEKRPLHGERE